MERLAEEAEQRERSLSFHLTHAKCAEVARASAFREAARLAAERGGEGEPVAWQVDGGAGLWATFTDELKAKEQADRYSSTIRPLYAAPQPAAPKLDARAVARAIHEPTEDMLNAARDWSVIKYGRGIGNDAAKGCWQAMCSMLGKGAATTAPHDPAGR